MSKYKHIERVLSIDLGTSMVKVIIASENGDILAKSTHTYQLDTRSRGIAEQSPEDWLNAINICTKELARKGNKIWPPDICSITGQMHGVVLLDKDGLLLRKAITWADFRAREEIAEIESQITKKKILQLTGNTIVPMMPGPKMLWIKKHEPHIHKKIKTLLFPKDYIGYIMTDEIATSPSDASISMFYNYIKRQWDKSLCDICAVPIEILPPLKPAESILGLVSSSFANKSSIPVGTPVIVGAGDMSTSIIGSGIISNKDVGISLGTASTVFRLANYFQNSVLGKIFYYCHAIDNMLISMGTCPGNLNINWFEKQIVRLPFSKQKVMGEINQSPISKPPELYFLPFLSGTGSPYMHYEPKGAFLGLSQHHNQEDLRLSIYEGISYSLKQSFELLMMEQPKIEKIFIGGGGVNNKDWLQVLANIIGYPLIILKENDIAVIGAAILGGYAAGWFDSIEEGVDIFVKEQKRILPQLETFHNYEAGYLKYLELSKMIIENLHTNR